MKFAYYSDIHHSGKSPSRRKDDYPAAVERKHRFIYQEGQRLGAEFFAFGGDMNEYHTVAYSVINKQFEIMREERTVPEYGIIGNHDVVGNNSEKMGFVPISTLYSSGYMQRLSPTNPVRIEGKDGVVIALFGRDIHKDMDNLRPEDYYIEKPSWCDHAILIAHGWLKEHAMNIEGVRHTTFADIMATGTQADLILTGHDHKGHGIVHKKMSDGREVIFHNPGSPTRIKAAEYEMERQVGFSMIDLTKNSIQVIFQPFPASIARPASEILDREALEADIKRINEREVMSDRYENFSLSAISPIDVILEIANEQKISKGAREDLVSRIEDEELKAAQKTLEYTV